MTSKKRLLAVSSALLLTLSVGSVAFADDLSASLSGGGGQGVASIQTLNASNLNYAIFAAGIGNITGAQILQGQAVVINLGSGNGGVATGSATGNVSDITNNPSGYSVRVQGTNGTVTGPLAFAAESGDGGGGGPTDGRIDTGDTSPCAAPGAAVLDGQFCITGFLTDQGGQDVTANFVAYTSDTVLAWAFDETNIEFLVKVLDTCAINGVRWIFAGGATDLAGQISVREVSTGLARVYTFGAVPFMTINDTQEGQACPAD